MNDTNDTGRSGPMAPTIAARVGRLDVVAGLAGALLLAVAMQAAYVTVGAADAKDATEQTETDKLRDETDEQKAFEVAAKEEDKKEEEIPEEEELPPKDVPAEEEQVEVADKAPAMVAEIQTKRPAAEPAAKGQPVDNKGKRAEAPPAEQAKKTKPDSNADKPKSDTPPKKERAKSNAKPAPKAEGLPSPPQVAQVAPKAQQAKQDTARPANVASARPPPPSSDAAALQAALSLGVLLPSGAETQQPPASAVDALVDVIGDDDGAEVPQFHFSWSDGSLRDFVKDSVRGGAWVVVLESAAGRLAAEIGINGQLRLLKNSQTAGGQRGKTLECDPSRERRDCALLEDWLSTTSDSCGKPKSQYRVALLRPGGAEGRWWRDIRASATARFGSGAHVRARYEGGCLARVTGVVERSGRRVNCSGRECGSLDICARN